MNKVLVKLYVPIMEADYDVWLPLNKKIYTVIKLLTKAVNEFNGGEYTPQNMPLLYNKQTAIQYNLNELVKDTNIKNGTEIILI